MLRQWVIKCKTPRGNAHLVIRLQHESYSANSDCCDNLAVELVSFLMLLTF